MTYYISGPMTGIKDLNRPAFQAAGVRLREGGHEFGLPVSDPRGYRKSLGSDIAWIIRHSDALYLLKGWEHSPGARAEHAVAVALELRIDYEGVR